MIRPIHESEMTVLLDMLWLDPAVNYFILVNHQENFSKIAAIDGIFHKDQLIGALFKRFSGNVQIYGTCPVDLEILYRYLRDVESHGLIGEYSFINKLAEAKGFEVIKQATIMHLDPQDFIPLRNTAAIATRAVVPEDAPAIKNLYRLTFNGSLSEALIGKNIRDKTGRGRAIIENGAVLAVVQTSFEKLNQVILYGVATHEASRGLGYAGLLLNEVIGEVVGEGKSIELLVENESAKSLYYQLGFKERTMIGKVALPTIRP